MPKSEVEKTTGKGAVVAKRAAFLFGLEKLFPVQDHGEKKYNYDQYWKTGKKFESPSSEPACTEVDGKVAPVGGMD